MARSSWRRCSVGAVVLAAAMVPGNAGAQTVSTASAYSFIHASATEVRSAFFLYRDQDDGISHGFPSGIFPAEFAHRIEIDPGCVDDPLSPSGCRQTRAQVDCDHGTVLRVTWRPMSAGQYAGIFIEEPEGYLSSRAGRGLSTSPATTITLRLRSPTGITVRFGFAGGESAFTTVPAGTAWTTLRLPLDAFSGISEPLSDVHLPFMVATNVDRAAAGGTLLLDDIRLEPTPLDQARLPALPRSNITCGIAPATTRLAGRVPIPPDQVNRNVASVYEASLALLALARRGTPADRQAATVIADGLLYAQAHDNQGLPLRGRPGAAGWRNAYMPSLVLHNDQVGGARSGDVRLAGFTGGPTLCGASSFCLVLDGATGGNSAFAIMGLIAAWRQLGDVRYLDAARRGAQWIAEYLQDTATDGFGGYFLGYPDEGVAPKTLIHSKSVENNADIASAMFSLSAVEQELGRSAEATRWSDLGHYAGAFVMRMFDDQQGRFVVGTAPVWTTSGCPAGERRGSDVVVTCDFLDANTFSALALSERFPYRDQIDWRRPLRWAMVNQAQRVTAAGQVFQGFNIVASPVSGPTGIAPEFSGQMVVALRRAGRRYGDQALVDAAESTLLALRRIRAAAFGSESTGAYAAAALDGGDTVPPAEQCISTPYQCIAQRVGLAATVWAGILAEDDVNPFDVANAGSAAQRLSAGLPAGRSARDALGASQGH